MRKKKGENGAEILCVGWWTRDIANENLDAEEVGNFVEEIELDFFHREAGAEGVDDGFAAAAGEVDLDLDSETFFRDENGGKM